MKAVIIATALLWAGCGLTLAVLEAKRFLTRCKVIITEYIPLYRIRKSGGKKRMRLKKKSSRRRLRPTGANTHP